jgi:hypothetical protein
LRVGRADAKKPDHWHLRLLRPRHHRPSLNHLISGRQQRFGDGKAKRLGGLEVDNETVFGWGLDWQLGGLRTLEDAIDVSCCLAELAD